MDSDNEKNGSEARVGKAYVKPAVVKHMAAALATGSVSCNQYTAQSSNPCVAGLVTNVNTYYH